MRTLRIAVILFLSMVINYQAQGQTNNSELKIGYVNPQSILANMPEMRAVQQRLQNFTVMNKKRDIKETLSNAVTTTASSMLPSTTVRTTTTTP